MPCYTPLKAYRSADELTSGGKRAIKFKLEARTVDKKGAENFGTLSELFLPCGQCIGCRLERSRQWAIRCLHESELHEQNSFLTLTIDQEKLKPTEQHLLVTLQKNLVQKFIKRLRKSIYPKKISYYYCGEYGENYARPHYHICLFGHDFNDKQFHKKVGGNILYRSDSLNALWGYGHCLIGDVTFDSAAYVARYITKKINGPKADEHYCGRLPEYTNMSKKPAIGLRWIEKYKSDVYPSDEVILKGRKVRPARYYDKYLEKHHLNEFENIKINREELAERFELSEESDPKRTLVKHEIQLVRLQQLQRNIEQSSPMSVSSQQDYDRKAVEYFQGVLYESK